jgi:AcrR family transcriptional regulator
MARPRQVSDEDILTAAKEILLEHGAKASTTAIAKAVGLSQAALFKRFGTKLDLVKAALAPKTPRQWWLDAANGPDPSGDFRTQLESLANVALADMHVIVPRLMAIKACGIDLQTMVKSYEVPPPVGAAMALGQWLHRAQEAGQIRSDANLQHIALMLLGSLNVRAFHAQVLQGTQLDDDEAYVASVVDMLWNGLKPGVSS